jgi:protein FRA10AC1
MARRTPVTDLDVLRARHEFIPESAPTTAYDAALHREWALVDLSRVPSLGLRFRTHAEVESGKGQFTCAALACDAVVSLRVFELPFAYRERGEDKSALVKATLCGACAQKAFARRPK